MRRLACIAVLAGIALVPVASGSRERSPSLATLLARHVPILVLHPAEIFAPVPVDGFLADSDVMRKGPSGWEKVDVPLPVGGADLRLDQRLCRAVDGVAAAGCYAEAEAAHGAGPVVYGAAFRRGKRIDLQYWIWYPFNPYSPSLRADGFWQVHEGDWEAISVITDLAGKPVAAGYSQHSEGRSREWSRVTKRGLRPVVYVALGSHANYFAPGTHRFDPRVVDRIFISLIEQSGAPPVDRTGNGRVVRPRLVRIAGGSPGWMTFAGRWGEDEYVHAAGGQAVSFGSAGPPGPAFQEHWQRPVAEAMSWPKG